LQLLIHIFFLLDISVQRNRLKRAVLTIIYICLLNYLDFTLMQEDVQEDWGWKLVHGEVFRTPSNPLLLSVLIGNGAQLCAMVGVTLGKSFPDVNYSI
jgi:hypothetical protein